jgi:hypothetical protein
MWTCLSHSGTLFFPFVRDKHGEGSWPHGGTAGVAGQGSAPCTRRFFLTAMAGGKAA